MKKILVLAYILIAIQTHGAERGFSAGDRYGWNNIQGMENTVFIPGKGGYREIGLKSSRYTQERDTDLLIHFDSTTADETGSYSIVKDTVKITDKIRMLGKGAGVFLNTLEGLSLKPGEGTVFAPGNPGTSFTIEFWLNPVLLKTSEEIITYTNSLRDRDGSILPQAVTCTIEDRKLVWEFRNFFFNPESCTSSVKVTGFQSLIPEQWHHHMITYDENSGLVEYYVDSMLEGTAYATVSGKDNGDPMIPLTGSLTSGSFVIGENYHGFMDEFRISKGVISDPVLSEFQNGYGRIETSMIDMGRNSSVLNRIDLQFDTPGDSDIQSYYKIFKDYKDTVISNSDWIPFLPGQYLPADTSGRFFQVRIDLFANGSGTKSPTIHSIHAEYRKNLPPLAPDYVKAFPGDGEVRLDWKGIGEPDVAGYLVYYGTRKGVYFGKEGREGSSPIIVTGGTSITIHNLTNGRLYYFAVAAFDSAGSRYPGALSGEISARPLPGLNRDN